MSNTLNIPDTAQIITLLPFGGLMLYFLKRMLSRADKIDEEERAELIALRKEERELFNHVSEKLGTIFPLLYSAVLPENRIPTITKNGFNRIDIIKDTSEKTKELRSSLVEIEAKNKAYSGNKIFSIMYGKIIDELESIHRTIEAIISKDEEGEFKDIYEDVKKGINTLKEEWKFSNYEKEKKDREKIDGLYYQHDLIQQEDKKSEIFELCHLRLTCVLYRYRDLPDYLENKKKTEYEDSMISKYIGDKESYVVKEKILNKFDVYGVDKVICSWKNWRGFFGNIFYLLYFKVYWLMFLIIATYIPLYALMYKNEINYWWYLTPVLTGSVFVYLLGEYFLYKNYVKTKKYIERKVKKYKDREKAMEHIGERRWFNNPIIVTVPIMFILCTLNYFDLRNSRETSDINHTAIKNTPIDNPSLH